VARKVSSRKAPARSADLRGQEAQDDWALVDGVRERNVDRTEDEVLADATAAVDAVCWARRERSRETPREGRL
jgi:hypothetical protein